MMASSSPPELDAEIEAGIRSAREGRVVSLEEADARLRATIAAAQARARCEPGVLRVHHHAREPIVR